MASAAETLFAGACVMHTLGLPFHFDVDTDQRTKDIERFIAEMVFFGSSSCTQASLLDA